ncbi:MAG: MFS transporter, partial [Bacteroidota bacterium]|nr:MFS transporter [Bacteroidota bacterium]
DWKLILLAFGGVSLLSVIWLGFTNIEEKQFTGEKATIGSCLSLLRIGYVTLMVLAIFFVVGIDVGINSTSGQFLMSEIGMDIEPAKQGRSLYFFGKMLGAFAGALLLTLVSSRKFLFGSAVLTLITTMGLIYAPSPFMALLFMFLIGISAANIFPLVYSLTIQKFPERSNEISGLMIMSISGGALVPPVVGKIIDMFSFSAGMFVFVFCAIYILFVSIYVFKKKAE